jgi:hypothetical protein
VTASEALVLFSTQAAEPSTSVGPRVRIQQRLPPRLAIVSAEAPEDIAELRQAPAVLGVYEGPVPEDVLGTLSPGERLFALAWGARAQPAQRVGDGVDWDTAGFQPPDAPGEH